MKSQPLLLVTLLLTSTYALAADAVKIDIFLAGKHQQSVSLVGPNAKVKFSPSGDPDTTLELRLVAPEPVILELTETSSQPAKDGGAKEAVGRVTLMKSGNSFTVSDIKGSRFRNPYSLVRTE